MTEQECPICYDSLIIFPKTINYLSTTIIETTCKHIFHKHCLLKWINHNRQTNNVTCPCCRSILEIESKTKKVKWKIDIDSITYTIQMNVNTVYTLYIPNSLFQSLQKEESEKMKSLMNDIIDPVISDDTLHNIVSDILQIMKFSNFNDDFDD